MCTKSKWHLIWNWEDIISNGRYWNFGITIIQYYLLFFFGASETVSGMLSLEMRLARLVNYLILITQGLIWVGLKVGKSYILYIVDTLYNIYVISLNVKCLKQTHVHTYVAIVHNSIINELINNELIFSCDTQSHYEIRDLQAK